MTPRVITAARGVDGLTLPEVDPYWIERGLTAAYLLTPALWQWDLVTRQKVASAVGTGLSFVGDLLLTPGGAAGNGALLPHNLSTVVAPLSVAYGYKTVDTTGQAWTLLSISLSNWTGFFSGYGTNVGLYTTDNNSFVGNAAVSDTPNGRGIYNVVGVYASSSSLTARSDYGPVVSDASADAFSFLNTSNLNVVLGFSRRGGIDDNPCKALFSHFYVFNKALSDGDAQTLALEPMRLFRRRPRRLILAPSSVSVQIIYPSTDLSAGNWTPSTGGNLWAVIDEATASDTDYMSTPDASAMEVKLQPASAPGVTTGHVVRYRCKGAGVLTVSLVQGTTIIATWTHSPAPAVYTTFGQTLTGGQAAAITDYTDLRLRFTAS